MGPPGTDAVRALGEALAPEGPVTRDPTMLWSVFGPGPAKPVSPALAEDTDSQRRRAG